MPGAFFCGDNLYCPLPFHFQNTDPEAIPSGFRVVMFEQSIIFCSADDFLHIVRKKPDVIVR